MSTAMKVSHGIGISLVLVIGGLAFWFLIAPINFLLLVSGVLLTASLARPFWPKSTVNKRGDGRPLFPGEEEIYSFLAQKRREVITLSFWLLTSIFLTITGLAGYAMLELPYNLISLLFLIGAVAGFYFAGSAIIRPLADLGWWFVRPDENSAAIVERDRACWKIVINVNDPVRREHFVNLVEWQNQRLAEEQPDLADCERYVLLPPGQGIYFLGFTAWPWKTKLREPWYEREFDVTNRSVEPVRFCRLKERAWNLVSNEELGGILPIVGSADPIDIRAGLYLRIAVWDPYYAVYGADFTGESVCTEVAARWRQAVAELKYFEPGEGGAEGQYLDINPQIQTQAHDRLLFCLQMSADKKGALVLYPKISPDNNEPGGYKVDPDFPFSSPAWTCRAKFGFQIMDVEVSDLEPARKEIQASLEAKTTAAVAGMADYAKAQGEAKATFALAQGEAKATFARAEGEAKAIERRAEALSRAYGQEVWRGDIAAKVAGSVKNLTFVSPGGDTGNVMNMAATLAAAGGLPVRNSGEAEAPSAPVPAAEAPPAAPPAGQKPRGDRPRGGNRPRR